MNIFVRDHPGPAIDPAAWNKMKVGMTRDEVKTLLGEPIGTCAAGAQYKDSDTGEAHIMPEWWEYQWGSGVAMSRPSEKGYVVFFGESGRVSSFRDPIEQGHRCP